jgi:hypothetical protein
LTRDTVHTALLTITISSPTISLCTICDLTVVLGSIGDCLIMSFPSSYAALACQEKRSYR